MKPTVKLAFVSVVCKKTSFEITDKKSFFREILFFPNCLHSNYQEASIVTVSGSLFCHFRKFCLRWWRKISIESMLNNILNISWKILSSDLQSVVLSIGALRLTNIPSS